MSDITFTGVTRVFQRDGREFPTLAGIDLAVADREFVAIVGPSGCGKTTCMRMAAGLEFPTEGTVAVGGYRVQAPGPERAVVFQQFALFPWKSVSDNIDFGLKCKGMAGAERREHVERIIGVMGLQGYESAFPHQLSGGMQQRVAIAATLILQPRILLMDEPFGALDPGIRLRMQELLIQLWNEQQSTVFLVTHSVEEAVYLGDRVFLMAAKPGRLIEILKVPRPAESPEESRRKPWFINFCQTLLRRLEEESPAPPGVKV